jgi:predicted ATPase
MPAAPRKIVLTGAPGSGKSTICAALADRHPGRFCAVPEAATQYYRALGKRWDQLDLDRRRDAQRGIFKLQVAQEERFAALHPDRTLLLDRGTIDGAAYWPDGPLDYWRDLGTSEAQQLGRYATVIVLETAAAIGIYDGRASNEIRFEGAKEAIENAKVLAALWAAHPRTHLVPATPKLETKIAAVEEIVLATIADD